MGKEPLLTFRSAAKSMDCNIKARALKDREGLNVLRQAVILGWNGLCWNHSIFGRVTQASVSPLTIHNVLVSAMERTEVERDRCMIDSNAAGIFERFAQLHRITITVDDFTDAQTLQSGNEQLRRFDIVAAVPSNGKVFQYLCKEADIEVIAFDLTRTIPFIINKKIIDEAITRGIHFELRYSTLLIDGNIRKEVIAGAKQLVRILRGRNIIISSGSETVSQLRGVHDAINMGRLLNLTLEQSRSAVFDNWKKVVARGELRKRQRLPMQLATAIEVTSILAKKRKLKANDNSDNSSKLKKKQRRKMKQLEDSDEDAMDTEGGQPKQQAKASIEDEDEGDNQLAIFE